MLEAVVISAHSTSILEAERNLADTFNEWMEQNPDAKVVRVLEPVRYTGPRWDDHHVFMTFFYKET